MSLRAELMRLGLRWLLQRGSDPRLSIAQHRERIVGFERWVPMPPAGTATVTRELGGVPAVRIATPGSRPDRHILFLHGGGYVTGSPVMYRHITWRIAAAAAVRLSAIDYRLAPEHPFPAAVDDAVAAWRDCWLSLNRRRLSNS
jgi:monoterpene epsilon-lactone hydrolase